MKPLFENWRKYLLTERYSMQAAYEAIKPNNKKMYNLYKRHINQTWHEDIKHGYIDPEEEPEPKVPEEKINMAAAGYRNYILEIIPEDIWGPNATTPEQQEKEADKNQGLAMMWIRKLALKDQKLAGDIINGDISYSGRGGPYENIMPDLEIYFQNLDLMPKRNLIELESFEELHQMVEAAKEEIHARQQERQYLDAEEGTEVLRDDGEVYIAALHNKGAACELGKGTDWCTAAPGLDYFSDYYEPDDPLFFFKRKPKTDPDMPEFMQRGHKTHPAGEEKYQFHYGSEQFVNVADRPVNDKLFKVLHGFLMQTEAPQKYPVIQAYHYNLVADDPNTPPEELSNIAEALMSGDSELSSSPQWVSEVLTKVAKNSRTPLETLRMLSSSTNKFVIRSLSVNQQLHQEDSPEGMKLAKEIFLMNLSDQLIFDRGLKQAGRWIKAGIMSKEEMSKVVEDYVEAEELRKKARKAASSERFQAPLQERKIKIRIKI
jgi:hypothetical protein